MSAAALERAVREDGPGVLATLVRHLGGDFALAEDALQDALRERRMAADEQQPQAIVGQRAVVQSISSSAPGASRRASP